MAYCRFKLKEIIGIATETLSASNRSYDFIAFKNVEFENEDDLIQASQVCFKEGRSISTNEFTGTTLRSSDKSSKEE